MPHGRNPVRLDARIINHVLREVCWRTVYGKAGVDARGSTSAQFPNARADSDLQPNRNGPAFANNHPAIRASTRHGRRRKQVLFLRSDARLTRHISFLSIQLILIDPQRGGGW